MRCGLQRNIGQRDALEPCREQGLCVGEKFAHDTVDGPDNAALPIARIAFGADEQAFAHGDIDGLETDLTGGTQQAPAAVMALGGTDNAGIAQLAQDPAYDDRIGHQALGQGGRSYRRIGLLMQMNQGVEGERQAA